MASCVKNILAKDYQNLIICFQVTVENVGDVFWDTVYTINLPMVAIAIHFVRALFALC